MKKMKMAAMALLTVGITSLASAQSEQAPKTAPESKTVEAAPAVSSEAPDAVKAEEAVAKEEMAPAQAASQKLSPADPKKTLSEMEAEREKAAVHKK